MTPANLQKPLEALHELKREVKKRVGTEGGNLSRRLQGNFDLIEHALMSFDTVESMNKTISQTSQLVAKVMNDVSRLSVPIAMQVMNDMVTEKQRAALEAPATAETDDDETFETKGK